MNHDTHDSTNRGPRVFQNRAQLAIEFLMLMSISIIILMLYMGVTNGWITDYVRTRAQDAIETQGLAIQRELLLATVVHDGYSRTITIPQFAGPFNYTLSSTPGYISLSYQQEIIEYVVPNVSGNLTKGVHTIWKQGGIISVT